MQSVCNKGAHFVSDVCCLLSQWASHHLQIPWQHHLNLGCQDWCPSWQSSQGAHRHGVFCCLLSQWAPHHLQILWLHHSNLGCRDWCSSWQPSWGAHFGSVLHCLLSWWVLHHLWILWCTIWIWDAETGSQVGNPLKGHTNWVHSVAYSADGQHIISRSYDHTIQIWDAETGVPIGNPLEGHTNWVLSIAYSPDGCHIISRSGDHTIRIWDAKAGTAAGPLREYTDSSQSVAYPFDGKHIVSGSYVKTPLVLDAFPYPSIWSSSCNPMHPSFSAKPNTDGWVKDSEGGLLYWVPHDCHESVHSPAIIMIPLTSCNRSVSLDFDDFAFGTSWGQIFRSAPI